MYSKTLVTLLYALVEASSTLAAPYPMPVGDDVETTSQTASAKSKRYLKNPFAGIFKGAAGKSSKPAEKEQALAVVSKKVFEAELLKENHLFSSRAPREPTYEEHLYFMDFIPVMLPYMQKYTKDNLKKIKDANRVFNDYTTNVAMAGGKRMYLYV